MLVPNKCRASNKRQGSEARVLINAGSQKTLLQQYRVVRVSAIHYFTLFQPGHFILTDNIIIPRL